MMRVQRGQLGPLTPIGEPGGFGQVYRVGALMPIVSPHPLAYKELLSTLDQQVADETRRGMEVAVALRDTFSPVERDELDQLTTWPLAVVEENGRTAGILMRLLPADFFVSMKVNGRPESKVFELQYLCVSDDHARQIGLKRSTVEGDVARLALAAKIAYTINLLHGRQIVYGDLNLRNVAIAGYASQSRFVPPRAILYDCDAVAPLSDTSRKQGHMFAFRPPEIANGSQALQDLQTDVYKLGLCVIRALAKGPGATQLAEPDKVASALGQPGIDLITRALGDDRDNRPTAREIWECLDDRVTTLTRPPELDWAKLNRAILLRGSHAIVTWSQRYGTKLRIFGVNGFEEAGLDPDAHPHGYAIQPKTAGPIFVEVSNQYGSTPPVRAGSLDYFEPPKLNLERQLQGLLPRVRLPALPGVPLPHVFTQPPPRPLVSTDEHPPPRVRLPSIGVVPGQADVGGVFAGVYAQANRNVGEAMSSGLRTLLAQINAKVRSRVLTVVQDFDSDGADQP